MARRHIAISDRGTPCDVLQAIGQLIVELPVPRPLTRGDLVVDDGRAKRILLRRKLGVPGDGQLPVEVG
eukprot:3206292-Heterocapsa_arctica.AAC.1